MAQQVVVRDHRISTNISFCGVEFCGGGTD